MSLTKLEPYMIDTTATFTFANTIVSSNITLTTANIAVGNMHITGGSNNQILATDGTGNLSWVTPPITTARSIINAYVFGT
jgi:hypothetical protein